MRPTFKEFLAEQSESDKLVLLYELSSPKEKEWTEQGYHSFFKGVLSQDNPYTPDTKAGRAWFQGWKNARNNDTNFKHRSPDSVSIRMSPERSAGHS